MGPSRPQSAIVDRGNGSGGKIRTYDQAINSRPPLIGDPPENQARSQSPDPPAVVYRFYDINHRLLYIGLTVVGAGRWAQHSAEQPWWPDVALVGVEHHADAVAAAEAERLAIGRERPRHNVIHNGPHSVRRIPRPRRPSGSGGIFQRRDGLWVAQRARGPRGERVVRRLYRRTREAAELALATMVVA